MKSKLDSAGKSILIGGSAAGIVSLVPVINLLNLLMMMWMAAGGILCAYLLLQANENIGISDALVTGALSGAVGCALFGSVSYALIANISADKVERMLTLVNVFSSSHTDDSQLIELVQSGQLKAIFLVIIAVMFVFSLIAGALGGAAGRSMFKKRGDD